METLRAVLVSILGFTLCIALLHIASGVISRAWRIALSSLAALGLMLQGVLWSYVTFLLKQLGVGGSYGWLYAALATSVTGTVWAVVLLGTSLSSRRFTG